MTKADTIRPMSRMKREIEESMLEFSVNENGEPEAAFLFSEEFAGFQGHFPERKILPGVSQVACVRAVVERWQQRPSRIVEIAKAKYYQPSSPGETLKLKISAIKKVEAPARAEESGDTPADCLRLKALISRGEERISELTLVICFTGRPPASEPYGG